MRGFLGLDVGTSSLKAALIGGDGRLVVTAEERYDISTPAPGHVEGDPGGWIAAATTAVRRLSGALSRTKVAGVGVAGQMHGAALCDEMGRPIGPALLWPDRRAEAELDHWRALPEARRTLLANPLVPGMTGPMLAWLVRHRPNLVSRAAVVLHAKDVVRHALTDYPATSSPPTDRSDASATLLWNVRADHWAEPVVDAAGIPARLLPTVRRSYEEVGRTDWLARIVPTGPTDVPITTGAGDTPAALLAVGAGGVHVNLGTGAQVLVSLPAPDNQGAHPSTHLYADASDGWYAMAAVQNGGLALEHVARLFGLTWEELIAAAARGRAETLSFLPFLTGERGGVASPSSHGGWLGIGIDTTRDDLARAAVEGVVFTIRRGVELLGVDQGPDLLVSLSGGGWRAPLLVQLMADALQRPVQRVGMRSASAVGAALLAARCVGDELVPERSPDPPVHPADSLELQDTYQRWLARCEAASGV